MKNRGLAQATRWGAALAIAAAIGLQGAAATAQSVLKVAAANDLKVLDPVWTTDIITGSHAMMIFDNLFGEDSRLVPQPQMVESWTTSPDGMTWRFVLRPGLKFHDGTAVTARDVVPSIRRWGARVASGQSLMSRVGELAAIDDRTFEIRLKEKFGPVVTMLASSAGNSLNIMREKEATTDPFTAVTETIGSGPFIFIKSEWVPGSKVVYRKNPDYMPRKEPADGYSGGKVAGIDRSEWSYIPDANTATQALIAGEVDIFEYPPTDMLPVLARSPDVALQIADQFGATNIARPNHLVPPTNNPKVRLAMLYASDQTQVLDAMIGNKDLQKPCWAVFICGTPLDTQAGVGSWATPGPDNIAKAKALLAEAGYKGEKIVIMNPTTDPAISALVVTSASQLQKAGFNVDLQNTDWATLVTRRTVKDDPSKNPNGWHVVHTWSSNSGLASPLMNVLAPTPCDGRNWPGWPCDERLDAIRGEYATASTDAERKDVAARYQARFYEVVPYIPLGSFVRKIAYRKSLSGVLTVPNNKLPFWNIEKK